MESQEKDMKKAAIIAFLIVAIIFGPMIASAILIHIRPTYREETKIQITLPTSQSFGLYIPFILMNDQITPSFVEMDLNDPDKFGGNEDLVLDVEVINGSSYLKILAFGKNVNLSSIFQSSPFSTQDYTKLMQTHKFSAYQNYNKTYISVPFYFNATVDANADFTMMFDFSFKNCNNGEQEVQLNLTQGWNQYYVKKDVFQVYCE